MYLPPGRFAHMEWTWILFSVNTPRGADIPSIWLNIECILRLKLHTLSTYMELMFPRHIIEHLVPKHKAFC